MFNIKIPFVIASHFKKYASTTSLKNKNKACAVGMVSGIPYVHNGTGVSKLEDSLSAGRIVTLGAAFVEDATSLTHTATFALPAGSLLVDIWFLNTVLWTGGGTVNFTCGDTASANGYFTNTNLKATDLVLGERLQASNANNWGGVNGSYLTTVGRFGQQATNNIGGYQLNAYNAVIMVITESAPSTAVGRSFGFVQYIESGSTVTPVKA